MSELKENDLIALCDSTPCQIRHYDNIINKYRGIIKNVAKTKDTCPDCGHFLRWTRLGKQFGTTRRNYFKKINKKGT